MEQDMEHEIAQLLLAENAAMLRPDSPFTYASGIRSPIYCDNRLLLSDPLARGKVIDGFLALIAQHHLDTDVIGGTATAGIPWAAWIADRLDKPLIYIRSKAKEHGRQGTIEGKLSPGMSALIIEDLISTGASAYAAVRAVREAHAHADACLAIFTYEFPFARETFSDCPLHTLTRFSVLVEEAQRRGLPAADAQYLLQWKEHPGLH